MYIRLHDSITSENTIKQMNVINMAFVLWAILEMSFDKFECGIMMLLFFNHSSGSVRGGHFLTEV